MSPSYVGWPTMFEENKMPLVCSLRPMSRRLSSFMPETVGYLLNPKRASRTVPQSHMPWRPDQDNSMDSVIRAPFRLVENLLTSSQSCVTIKQKILESSLRQPLPGASSTRRPTSRLSHFINSSPRSSSSEDSSHSCQSDDIPYIDQPFKDGRRRKICHACNLPFGEEEEVDICDSCCFERPAGCRNCNWTGWGRCSTCVGHNHAITSRPFASGFTRVPFVGEGQEKRRLGSWGLRRLGTTT